MEERKRDRPIILGHTGQGTLDEVAPSIQRLHRRYSQREGSDRVPEYGLTI